MGSRPDPRLGCQVHLAEQGVEARVGEDGVEERVGLEHLPAYMNPDAFVFLPRLPRTSTAKTAYRRLGTPDFPAPDPIRARSRPSVSGNIHTHVPVAMARTSGTLSPPFSPYAATNMLTMIGAKN